LNLLRMGKYKLRVPAVCGSVTGKTIKEMKLGIGRAVRGGADIVELRMDGLRDWSKWKQLLSEDIPIILTNRPKREGGGFKGEEDARLEILRDGIEEGVTCIDLEFSTPRSLRDPLVADAKALGVTVLVSHHNFSTTPHPDLLMKTAEHILDSGCDIAKLVSFAKSPNHAMRMLDFLVRSRKMISVPIIAFAMGEAGRITRLISPIFGSPWIYAGVDKKTAPGQLDLVTAKEWVRELKAMEVRN